MKFQLCQGGIGRLSFPQRPGLVKIELVPLAVFGRMDIEVDVGYRIEAGGKIGEHSGQIDEAGHGAADAVQDEIRHGTAFDLDDLVPDQLRGRPGEVFLRRHAVKNGGDCENHQTEYAKIERDAPGQSRLTKFAVAAQILDGFHIHNPFVVLVGSCLPL
jgi:hypothetical protein